MATYVETKIIEGFAEALEDAGLDEPIAWPNVNFTPPESGGYIKFDLLPAETRQITLGDDGYNRLTGIAQFAVYWPEGQGMVLPNEIAGEIIAAFKRGTVITRETQNIRIVAPPYTLPAVTFGNWTQIAVRVPYQTDASNP